jgi:hypothetical protein
MEIKSPIAGDIFLNGKQIIVAYTAITGYQSNIIKTNNFSNTTTIKIPLTARYYVLIEHSMNRHYINRDPLIDFPNLGKKCHTYDNHTLIYDEQNNNLTYYFDKNSTNKTETDWISQANIELSHITHNDFAYTIQDDYLYLSDNEKALAIYGLAASPGFNIYGSIAWDWRDKFTSFNHPYQNNNNNRYQMKQSRNLFVDRNRAILVQTNGFCVFDITSPEHPRKIAQQSIQPIMNWTYDDHRLYISNQKGMTVFQIP